jgi:hypothetical protein
MNSYSSNSFIHSFIHSFIRQLLYSPLLDLGRFFNFVILYAVGRTPWMGDQPVERPLPTHRTTQIQNKHTHASSGIRTHDPSARAGKDGSCESATGHSDRSIILTGVYHIAFSNQNLYLLYKIYLICCGHIGPSSDDYVKKGRLPSTR